jgi:drug/metabolite transporter (DMT)-like permease
VTTNGSPARVHLALAAVAILFSANYIIAKLALAHFNPFAFAWLRVLGSSIALQMLLLLRHEPAFLPRYELRSVTLYSLLGVVINQLLFITGLSLTTAHEAAILITTIPIFTLAGTLMLKTETASTRNLIGIAIAAAGALLLLVPRGSVAHGGSERVLGDILIIINCASYAFYLVLSKSLMHRFSASRVIAQIFSIGTILMFPFCLPGLMRTRWESIPLSAWLSLAAVIAGPTVAAYLINGWALARATSTAVAAYTYVQPFLASLLAAIFLSERLTAVSFLAAVLIVAGVFLASARRRDPADLSASV